MTEPIAFMASYVKGKSPHKCAVMIDVMMGYNVTIRDIETNIASIVNTNEIEVAYEGDCFVDLVGKKKVTLKVTPKVAGMVDVWLTKVSCYNHHRQW